MNARGIVLIVDDDPEVMAAATDIFEWLGYDIVAADSPSLALEILHTMGGGVRLLFTDVVMPEMDGFSFADAARLIVPGLGIIYTSGAVKAHGEAMFVPKPYTAATIAEAVARLAVACTSGADAPENPAPPGLLQACPILGVTPDPASARTEPAG
jgi:CheY-like chemotaxis protein